METKRGNHRKQSDSVKTAPGHTSLGFKWPKRVPNMQKLLAPNITLMKHMGVRTDRAHQVNARCVWLGFKVCETFWQAGSRQRKSNRSDGEEARWLPRPSFVDVLWVVFFFERRLLLILQLNIWRLTSELQFHSSWLLERLWWDIRL